MDTRKKPKLLPPKKGILEAFFSLESMAPQASTSSTAPIPPENGNTLETSSVSRASQESPSHLHSSSMTEIKKKEDQEKGWGFLEFLEGKPNDSSLMIHQEDVLKKSHDDVKKKGVYTPPYTLRRLKSGKIDRTSSIHIKKGQISTYAPRMCVICKDFKPARETSENVICKHDFCWECVEEYVIKQIQEYGMPIKCPEKNCKDILSEAVLEYCVPDEQLDLWEISAHDARVLAKLNLSPAEPYPFDLNCSQDYMNSIDYDPAEPYLFDLDWMDGGGDWEGDEGGR